MKERTKDRVRDGFGCLINNAAAIRGAKNGPLWLTIVMFFLSVLLPVLPLFISAMNTNGSAFISSTTFGLEKNITQLATDLKNEGHEFMLDENHEMTVANVNYAEYVTFDSADDTKIADATPLKTYVSTATSQYELVLYVSDLSGNSKQASNLNTFISNIKYKVNTTDKLDAVNDPEGTKYYSPTYMIAFKDTIYVVVCYQDKAVAASMGGNYSNIKPNSTLLATLLTVKDKEGNTIEANIANLDYCNGVLKNFRSFLNKTYDAIKYKNTFTTSGIYAAIFLGLSLFMGLLMWIMTRGKNNPNNYFTLWLCMKVEARLGLAPALITLVLGLFLTQYASMIFILTLGLRVMWISMKELRPVQQ